DVVDGYPVKALNENLSFARITDLTLPPLARIPNNTFRNNSNLKTIKIVMEDNSPLYIGEYAFANCPNLTTVRIEVTKPGIYVKYGAFYQCTSLTDVYFSKHPHVETDNIDNLNFYWCTKAEWHW
ncbi:MAG: leucine-rich repeat protein, partial [Clostridia bacterium]|nr:leucine-rich repeat protein [Clostridia bacterium]